jgi:hypothetical protein
MFDKIKKAWRGWNRADGFMSLLELVGLSPRQFIITAISVVIGPVGVFVLSLLHDLPLAHAVVLATLMFGAVIWASNQLALRKDRVQRGKTVGAGVYAGSVPLDVAARQANKEAEAAAARQQSERDLLFLLNFAVNQSTVTFLNELIQSAPLITDDWPATHEAVQEYLAKVQAKVARTDRGSSVQFFMETAAQEAEGRVRNTPEDQRPAGLNILDYRSYLIARLQFDQVTRFLAAEVREVEGRITGQRNELIQRLAARNRP